MTSCLQQLAQYLSLARVASLDATPGIFPHFSLRSMPLHRQAARQMVIWITASEPAGVLPSP